MDGTVVIQGLFTLHRHLSGIRAPHRRGFFLSIQPEDEQRGTRSRLSAARYQNRRLVFLFPVNANTKCN